MFLGCFCGFKGSRGCPEIFLIELGGLKYLILGWVCAEPRSVVLLPLAAQGESLFTMRSKCFPWDAAFYRVQKKGFWLSQAVCTLQSGLFEVWGGFLRGKCGVCFGRKHTTPPHTPPTWLTSAQSNAWL